MAVKVAAEGNIIEFNNGIKGVVERVYENSVIVAIIENHTPFEYEGNRTVVNHKKYRIVSSS